MKRLNCRFGIGLRLKFVCKAVPYATRYSSVLYPQDEGACGFCVPGKQVFALRGWT